MDVALWCYKFMDGWDGLGEVQSANMVLYHMERTR